MLSFDIGTLREQAVTVDAVLPATDEIWQDGDPRPAGDGVHVTGRLSPAGPGRFYWHARIDGSVEGACRRCLVDASESVHDEAHYIYAEDEAEAADDPDMFVVDPGAYELDLRPAVREQWLLAAPGFVTCRPDCKGLCASCGVDLNSSSCDCPPATDVRWDALRAPRETAE